MYEDDTVYKTLLINVVYEGVGIIYSRIASAGSATTLIPVGPAVEYNSVLCSTEVAAVDDMPSVADKSVVLVAVVDPDGSLSVVAPDPPALPVLLRRQNLRTPCIVETNQSSLERKYEI